MSVQIRCATGALNRIFTDLSDYTFVYFPTVLLKCKHLLNFNSTVATDKPCLRVAAPDLCIMGQQSVRIFPWEGAAAVNCLIVSGSGHWHRPVLGVFGLIHWAAYRLTHIFSVKKAYGSDWFSFTTLLTSQTTSIDNNLSASFHSWLRIYNLWCLCCKALYSWEWSCTFTFVSTVRGVRKKVFKACRG